ncbi:phosphomannomutase [Poseidonocella sp. HB161398]|uniref:phosphomannomutase n=1 Tax=Poseidonocella sp. HB161398 TaxID=2320855 RepID=UPI0011090055|nr:phosphomannomutase [Poseidonocella sp. HB161398]
MRHTAFKSYDIRGRLGVDLDADLAYRIGRGYARVFAPALVAVGRDIRESSPELAAALARGLADEGVEVKDLGLCGTEEIYFAADHLGAGGGLMVTASHNPIDYNGIKMVREGARPISWDSGLGQIHDLVMAGDFGPAAAVPGTIAPCDIRPAYVEKVLSFAPAAALAPLKIVVNAGNGAAGPTFDALAPALEAAGIEFVRVHHEPDSAFPNGIPNPLLPENRAATAEAVTAAGADFGVAWDGDFDRCFLFDETGGFVDGEYIVALLAQAFLAKVPGARIVHDPRVQWNTQATVAAAGGEAVVSRTGHALIKAKMREVDAVYGGEMSAHHYFRDFMYCDSGMIPWLVVAELVCRAGRPLGELVAEMRAGFPSSGEINFHLEDPEAALARVEAAYLEGAEEVDRLDGLSLAYPGWRVNLRKSNTEPVLRLNVETRGDRGLLEGKVAELSALIAG